MWVHVGVGASVDIGVEDGGEGQFQGDISANVPRGRPDCWLVIPLDTVSVCP